MQNGATADYRIGLPGLPLTLGSPDSLGLGSHGTQSTEQRGTQRYRGFKGLRVQGTSGVVILRPLL